MKLSSAAEDLVALAARLSPAPRLYFETTAGVEEPPPHVVGSGWGRALRTAGPWMMFRRGASLMPERLDRAPPHPLRLPGLTRPWTTTRRPGSLDLARIDVRLVAAAVAAAAMIVYG